MSSETVARRYATALADAVGSAEPRVVQEELVGWQSLIESSTRLQQVFSSPTIGYDQKRKVLEEMIALTKVRPATANFLRILVRNQRLTELGEINHKFAQVLDERSGVMAAQVTTARPVSEKTRNAVAKKLAMVTGKEIRLSFETDETLVGGIVTKIGSTVYDGSIRSQLLQMKKRLAGN